MNEREAIKYIEQHGFIADDVKDMAIKAIEKQISMKTLDIITEYNEYVCTICSCCQKVSVEINDKYCRNCGQKLDWSVEHE